ncbi:MAG: cytochrome c biogenesis protein ResB [Dehalococcoidia bacterium]
MTAWLRFLAEWNPLPAVWRLLTNVRWAIALIAFLALSSLLGVLLPQIPDGVRGNSAAVSAWLESQRDNYGFLTDVIHRLGLFDVFHARWFAVSLGLLVASLLACTVNRFPTVWRSIRRPQKRMPDTYFERAQHRASFATPADAAALEAVLRRHHYRVERIQDGQTVYLFADRFSWAQLGTFLTHSALILFIVAAVVSNLTGFSQSLFLAEGATAPVRPSDDGDGMQVQVIDAVARFSHEGQPLDYRTEMIVLDGGQETKRCTTSVNGPCTYGGYRFHQAAYFGFGAELQVRDLASASVVYREVLALADTMPGPHVVIRDGDGRLLLDETLVLTDLIESVYGTTVVIPGDGRLVWIGAKPDSAARAWQLLVFELGDNPDPARLSLAEGEKAHSGGLEFEFVSLNGLPATVEPDFPLPPPLDNGLDTGTVLLQMSNAAHGVVEPPSDGSLPVAATNGSPTLSIIGVAPYALALAPGQSSVLGHYEYTFLGQREFAGIQVERDPSDNLIWAGAGLLLLGLAITFYVPRRRLWAKIATDRTYLAGVAGYRVGFRREMAKLGTEAGLADAMEEEGQDGSS